MSNGRPSFFGRFAKATATVSGRPTTFIIAVLVIVVWAITGPIFRYSDTWQLVINTATTIVTFLMVFLIQNSQNRESLAIQLKLDELISGVSKARNEIISLEDMDEKELEGKRQEMLKLAEEAKSSLGEIKEQTDATKSEAKKVAKKAAAAKATTRKKPAPAK